MKKYFVFFTVVLLVTFFSILTPTYGQWQKNVIDDNMTTAVSVDVADMDGDTKPDLIVTNTYGNELIYYQNNFPSWNKRIIDTNAPTVSFAWSADINSNNILDVVACLYGTSEIVWYQNNYPFWNKRIIDANTDNADYIVVADLDNDDTLDVVTAGFGGGGGGDVVWYENNHPVWTKHIIEPNASGVAVLIVTDIDGDDLLDVVATMDNTNAVVWFKNEGMGLAWTKYTIDDDLINAWGLSIGDLDGDDSIDIVATTGGPYGVGSDVVWYENNYPAWTKHVIDTVLNGANIVSVADVDGDDTLDIIADGYFADDVVWYENNHPNWTKHMIDDNLDGPRVFAVADIDGDEINDLIVPGESEVVWYKNPYATVGVEEEIVIVPTEYSLNQNYPNPFNPTTTINYSILKQSSVTLKVYDVLGREVTTLVNQQQKAGYYEVDWNGANNSSGVYFYRIQVYSPGQASGFVDSKKMILLR